MPPVTPVAFFVSALRGKLACVTGWDSHRIRTDHTLSRMSDLTLESALAMLIAHEGIQMERQNNNVVRLPIPTPEGTVNVGVLLNLEAGAAAMYTVHPAQVAEDRRVEAAFELARFNYGLMSGALEMDADDGELRVRTGVDFGGGPATVQALFRALELNLGLREAAAPLFAALCS